MVWANCSKCAENKYSHEVPEHPNNTAIPNCIRTEGIPEKLPGFWQPTQVGGNLTATKRCDTTTSANPSDGRSGYRAPPASRKTPGKPARKNERREKRRREQRTDRQTGPTPLPREQERGARDQDNRQGKVGKEAHWPVGTLALWLWHSFVSALHRH